jgi:phage protein D
VGLPGSETRLPTVSVAANGAPIPGIIEVELEANNYLAANRFRVVASLALARAAIWAMPDLQLRIQFGLNGAVATAMVGVIDRVSIDVIQGRVSVEGRDLTSRFIAARTEEAFENQTASGIATLLASRQGLLSAVTPTTTPIGRYYQNGHTRTTLGQHARATTQWDLLTHLAELEGFEVWVDGITLNFAPPSGQFGTLAITPRDCLSLTLDRSISLSNPIDVVVNSWDCRGQQAIAQTASANASASAGAPSRYVVVRPNLTSVAARTLAQTVANQMAGHARTIRLEMPGDLTTAPRSLLTLADTGTDFDGNYVVSSIDRRLSMTGGFTQSIEARSPYWTISST